MKYILSFFSVVFLFSCSSVDIKKEIQQIGLMTAENLSAAKRKVNVNLYRPARMYIYQDKLIILDIVDNDMFKVFSIPDITYKYAFGRIGPGPDEFMDINKENINISESMEILSLNKLFYYDLGDTSALQIKRPALIITKANPINNFTKMNDSIYVLNNEDYSKEYRHEFRTFNLNSKKEKTMGDVLLLDKDENIAVTYQRLMRCMCHHPKEKKLVVFQYNYPMFRLLSDDGELIKVVTFEKDLRELVYTPGKVYFSEPCVTENYIYVMWVNRDKKEVESDFEHFRPELMVFDWDGNLIKRFGFNQPVITFTISEKLGKIYGVSFLEDDINTIYEYDLPELTPSVSASVSAAKYKELKSEFCSFEVPSFLDIVNNDGLNYISTYKDEYSKFGCILGGGNKKWNDFFFEQKGKVVEIHVAALVEDFSKFYDEIKHIITTFQISNN